MTTENGQVLNLEQIQTVLDPIHDSVNIHRIVSQTYHPITNQLMFTIHPCETKSSLLRLLESLKPDGNPVILLMSMIGKVIHLDFDWFY